jgi:hypothetical protein
MQITNGGKTYALTSATFASASDARAIRGHVNADGFCGFAVGEIYLSKVDVQQTADGWEIINFAWQTPVAKCAVCSTPRFPSASFCAALNPVEVTADAGA